MSDGIRLLRALHESGIRRVAVVDDAFDWPEVPEVEWGNIRAALMTPAFGEAIVDHETIKALHSRAIAAIEDSEFDADDLIQFSKLLFNQYSLSLDPVFDPGGHFSRKRGESLASLQPILAMLNREPEVTVSTIGSVEDDDFKERIADIDLVFADFFLGPEVLPGTGPDEAISKEAESRSRQMINAIIAARGKVPSIVLMSSKDVAARAGSFRMALGTDHGRVVAARFQFVEKNHLRLRPTGEIEVQEPAADTLLDILQTFKFGEGLSVALELWKSSAKKAIEATADAISELEIRDFAYLIRFRLEKEGQHLIEYMEWLLGEYLTDEVASRFYSAVKDDPSVRLVSETQKSVEGAYDGQTDIVAKIYHHVRVQEERPGRDGSLRMGDLFLEADGQKVSVVITPDCDLIARHGSKPRAKRLTMVNGVVKPFDGKNTSAADFIMIRKEPKNIQWSKKDIQTQEFSWAEEAGRSRLGTLRPIYAQQLQRTVLHDLGRVGVAPWPALYVETEVELWYLDNERRQHRLRFPEGTVGKALIMPRRPEAPADENHVAVFTRSIIRRVRNLLIGLDLAAVCDEAAPHLASLASSEGGAALFPVACGGIALEASLPHEILVTNSNSPGRANWAWLFLRVS
jgi:hypothetical protein